MTDVTLTWYGHATVLLEIEGTRLITDPLLRRRVGPLARRRGLPALPPAPEVDAVLLSHLHHDHADVPSLRQLPGVPVLTGDGNRGWLAKTGLAQRSPDPDGWWRFGETQIRLVDAAHDARPMPHRPSTANGFVIRRGDAAIWFAGDTSLMDSMSGLPGVAGARISLALLPIGGWGPRLSPGHMGPTEAAEAAARVDASDVVPIHFGTLHPAGWPKDRLDWVDRPGSQFAGAIEARSDAAAHLLPVGATTTIRLRS